MHTTPMADSEGDFGERHKSSVSCPKCSEKNCVYQVWESHCGGFEDYFYTCESCKKTWWVDGIDS